VASVSRQSREPCQSTRPPPVVKSASFDADIYGHSCPAMLGIADARPYRGRGHDHAGARRTDLKVMSIGMLKPRRDQVGRLAWPHS
jgi:ATP-binding protein involved in chromosome partitioning